MSDIEKLALDMERVKAAIKQLQEVAPEGVWNVAAQEFGPYMDLEALPVDASPPTGANLGQVWEAYDTRDGDNNVGLVSGEPGGVALASLKSLLCLPARGRKWRRREDLEECLYGGRPVPEGMEYEVAAMRRLVQVAMMKGGEG